MPLLERYPTAAPCTCCGDCCRVAPCSFGEWDEAAHRCRFLTPSNKCDRYEFILEQPSQAISPAFGAGCCRRVLRYDRSARDASQPS